MKIGILTYHRGLNHGGFLQAYGLYLFLKQTGHTVEIIDYYNSNQEILERKVFFFFRPWYRLWALRVRIANIIKARKFSKSFSRFNTSEKVDNSSIGDVTQNYDLIVLGSDEIWNVLNPCYPTEVRVFMGESINSRRIISYAPSMGVAVAADLNKSDSIRFLSKLDDLSVRDEHSQSEISTCLGYNPPILPDPTFLVDLNEALNVVNKASVPYMLVYLNGIQLDDITLLSCYAKRNGLKIISISYYQYWADQNIISVGVEQWLSWFKNATCIATNTYHGLIFSFQNAKPVYIVDPSSKYNKISGLAKQFNFCELLDFCVSNQEELADYFKLSESIFKKNLNLIIEQRLLAYTYLKNNIDAIKN